jgi:hypothetical protein
MVYHYIVQHSVAGDTMTFKCCLCVDNKIIILDTYDFRDEPVFCRMLGKNNDFAVPEVDEHGRLLFLKHFGIKRSEITECIMFLRSGYIGNIELLFRIFAIFGGCKKLDKAYTKIQALRIMEETKTLDNPLHPCKDYYHLYKFEIHTHDWAHADDWEACCNINNNLVWWRKRNQILTDEKVKI